MYFYFFTNSYYKFHCASKRHIVDFGFNTLKVARPVACGSHAKYRKCKEFRGKPSASSCAMVFPEILCTFYISRLIAEAMHRVMQTSMLVLAQRDHLTHVYDRGFTCLGACAPPTALEFNADMVLFLCLCRA